MELEPITINPNRIPLDEAYLQMAEVWARRSKANRLQVGAILVKDEQIISDGYNGMPSGWHDDVCETYGPSGELVTKPELLHAESNCLLKIVRNGGMGAIGATLYTTDSPCPECAKLIRQSKIARVVYRRQYRLTAGLEMLQRLGVQFEQLQPPSAPHKCPPTKGWVLRFDDGAFESGRDGRSGFPCHLLEEATVFLTEYDAELAKENLWTCEVVPVSELYQQP